MAKDANIWWAKEEYRDLLWKEGSTESLQELMDHVLPLAKEGDLKSQVWMDKIQRMKSRQPN